MILNTLGEKIIIPRILIKISYYAKVDGLNVFLFINILSFLLFIILFFYSSNEFFINLYFFNSIFFIFLNYFIVYVSYKLRCYVFNCK